jgi:homoserine O-acetyltransferase
MNTDKAHLFGSDYHEVIINNIITIADDVPLRLDCGLEISSIPIAYETYGTLNKDASNAILICHALTGDQFVASTHPVTGKSGWWETMIGSGKAIDTDKYFVICSNVIGSCMGSWGPKSINPATGKSYGLDFPVITIFDMVRAQARLITKLGISKLFAVIGGSMGGMQVLGWTALFPTKVHAAMPIATTPKHSAQNIAFHEIGRQAIMADPEWCGGRYMDEKRYPAKGLSVARMTAHVTYLSESALHQKFGRELQNKESVSFGFEADFQIESYLRHQGKNFVERFDANAYLYITRAMDYYDLSTLADGSLADVFRGTDTRFCVISFSSDWLYPTEESRAIVRALNGVAADVRFAEITTDKGHDAFLLDIPELSAMVEGFLRDVSLKASQ